MLSSITRAVLTGLVATALASGGTTASLAQSGPIYVDQGSQWPADADPTKPPNKRDRFYVTDQGSQLMPLAWLKALKQIDGAPFLADSLARYGYLANPRSRDDLPVGFSFTGPPGGEIAGMTCAACHTRQITVAGATYRIDGGPAIVDFQSLLSDIDKAFAAVVATPASFKPFADAVLGTEAGDPDAVANLSRQVKGWYGGYHTLMAGALPATPWGPSRLDAVGMIFNRLTGLDIGTPPDTVIPGNIHRADAPTRYPFLWNAPIQDHTQWPGFAENGNDILALSRNVGEVFGVFGTFQPKPEGWRLLGYDYLSGNSANFDGLRRLEDLVKDIGPPRWPWTLNMTLVRQGEAIFARPEPDGCKGCHGVSPGKSWPLEPATWATPVQDVGTDAREHANLQWRVKSGVLTGASIPPVLDTPLPKDDACAFAVLATSVVGSIIQSYAPFLMAVETPAGGVPRAALRATALALSPRLRELQNAFPKAGTDPSSCTPTVPKGTYPYESRVLEGIWATAPYLHNGSVPTLEELLKKPADRVTAFKIGSNYDVDAVGLAKDQSQFDYTLKTGCGDRHSGDSNCGHDYGTNLSADEKRALLEYLKSL